MNEQELFESFCDLFDGNRSAVGTEFGGCLRTGAPGGSDVWRVYVGGHLTVGGDKAIGVYPLVYDHITQEWLVKWGCIDWDDGEEESFTHARNVQNLLQRFGVTGWLERSRSKGWHLWVFAEDWTPAWIMRRGLLMACKLVDAPTREINPKAESSDDPLFLGNYVRLPYPGWLSEGMRKVADIRRRSLVSEQGDVYPLADAVGAALHRRGIGQLETLARAYKPPAPVVHREVKEVSDEAVAEALLRCRGLTELFIQEGPRERGRSEWLFITGCQLVKDGLHSYDEMVALLTYADAMHGEKFTHRRDAEQRYAEIIDKGLAEL